MSKGLIWLLLFAAALVLILSFRYVFDFRGTRRKYFNFKIIRLIRNLLIIGFVLLLIIAVLTGVGIYYYKNNVSFRGFVEEHKPEIIFAFFGVFVLGISGRLLWYLFRTKVIEGEPFITEKAREVVWEFGGMKLPVLVFKLKKRGYSIILGYHGNLYERLYVKLNTLANCDLMSNANELRRPKYKVAVLIGTDKFFLSSSVYGTEGARDEMHNEIDDFLARGNYLVATHDVHFWDKVGHFSPPECDIIVTPRKKKHAICRSVNPFRMFREEGSKEKGPIRINFNRDVKAATVLFFAENDLESCEPEDVDKFEKAEYPAGWLLKYKKNEYNIFYWYPAHSIGGVINNDVLQVIRNAAGYFLRK